MYAIRSYYEIKQEDVINFPNGLFAFENAKSFALLTPLGREASPMWLQCIEEVVPCFIVFNPHDLIVITSYSIHYTKLYDLI